MVGHFAFHGVIGQLRRGDLCFCGIGIDICLRVVPALINHGGHAYPVLPVGKVSKILVDGLSFGKAITAHPMFPHVGDSRHGRRVALCVSGNGKGAEVPSCRVLLPAIRQVHLGVDHLGGHVNEFIGGGVIR